MKGMKGYGKKRGGGGRGMKGMMKKGGHGKAGPMRTFFTDRAMSGRGR